MLIVSWNVAGLSTTVNRINEAYGNAASKKKPSKVLAEYLRRHGADICCCQEHKIPLSQLSTRSEPLGCSDVEGYESFWSCCIDASKRGFNGVVTYVKKGMILSANSRPLGAPELDDQGRCVMTDHGKFVIFNVYVPAGGGQPLSYKMKFLNALRTSMKEQQKKNKDVILVGDLNISHTKKDIFWSDRVLFINDICREVISRDPSKMASLPKWQVELAEEWPTIETALSTKKVIQTKTTNTLTNKKYDKYRMTVEVGGKQIALGSHEQDPEYCEYYYDFQSREYTCADTNKILSAREENVISISVLTELMSKIAGIHWDEKTQRMISDSAADTGRVSPPRKWLNDVIEEDRMVDVFRHFYPSAEGRFTCWHQFTNKRYSNEGARIDFTLVDSTLLQFCRKGDVESLRCSLCQGDANSEMAALSAATANGGFQPVSFEGGGIMESTQDILDTQFGTPHTGMIYTPPSFSDHIGVSLLLDDGCCSSDLKLNEQNASTRKSQPHKAQRSISSFFSASTNNHKQQLSSTSTKQTLETKPLKRKGIQKFFLAKSLGTDGENVSKEKRSRTTSAPQPANKSNGPSLKASSPKHPGNNILNHFTKQE